MSAWKSIADLFVTESPGEVALIGAPMEAGSVTPGRCDLAPEAVRSVLRRLGTYDVETGAEIDLRLLDAGDVDVRGVMPADGFDAIRQSVRRCTEIHDLTILLGGNNAVTRAGAHALGLPLAQVGLITLDAHFDLRDTGQGLGNGNPIRALLEDGLPGRNICQIGLAPFANTARMHRDALAAGIGIWTVSQCRSTGIVPILEQALERIGHAEAIMIDFDIDVIDRAECPGAPGARPNGLPATLFFEAARFLAQQPKVRLVDLTEFDPELDVGQISQFTAGRWVCEILAGVAGRPR